MPSRGARTRGSHPAFLGLALIARATLRVVLQPEANAGGFCGHDPPYAAVLAPATFGRCRQRQR